MKPDSDARADAMLRDLKRAGLKMTPQRIAIVRLFAGDESHPTAQDLYERLLPDFPSMSFATVYNTLDALAGAGLAGTLRLDNGAAARFDPNTAAHHHAVCDRCGAVRDVGSKGAPKTSTIEGGFHVRAVERVYRGLCAACAAKSRRES